MKAMNKVTLTSTVSIQLEVVHFRHGRDPLEAEPRDAVKWSGDGAVPAIGSTVMVRMNDIGLGRVVGHFVEDSWLGVLVVPNNPPHWYIKQNGRDTPCHCFGTEIELRPEL